MSPHLGSTCSYNLRRYCCFPQALKISGSGRLEVDKLSAFTPHFH